MESTVSKASKTWNSLKHWHAQCELTSCISHQFLWLNPTQKEKSPGPHSFLKEGVINHHTHFKQSRNIFFAWYNQLCTPCKNRGFTTDSKPPLCCLIVLTEEHLLLFFWGPINSRLKFLFTCNPGAMTYAQLHIAICTWHYSWVLSAAEKKPIITKENTVH